MTNATTTHEAVTVASVFAAPVMLDKAATILKACNLIKQAAEGGAQLVVFPESFVPGFPIWTSYRKPVDNHEFFTRFALNSLAVPSPEIRQIAEAAAVNKIFVSLGFSEVSTVSAGCLWNSNILFGDDGSILNHHRKLVPTFYEKLVWASGDGAGLKVCNTRIGRIGSLICGENNNTLARFSLIAQGEQIHTASFPSVWPFRNPLGQQKAYDLREANRIRVSAHCLEGKVFSIVSSSYLDEASLTILADGDETAMALLMATPRASSFIVGPEGDVIAESSVEEETIIYGELDLIRAIELKQHHDLAGYYKRFDVFDFSVDRKRHQPMHDRTPSNSHDVDRNSDPLYDTFTDARGDLNGLP